MADLFQGAYHPQSYSLQAANLITGSGEIDIKLLVTSFSFFEDIYSYSVSGSIDIVDSYGYIELLKVRGNEFIQIDLRKYEGAPVGLNRTFRLFKVGNLGPMSSGNSFAYKLHFCSQEMVLSEQTKIKKSYSGKKIDFMVKDILSELKVDTDKINKIESTTGMYDFVIPRLKPFEAINWLSIYARPAATGAKGADMIFYETQKGYNFKSLQSMYAQDVYATYKYQAKNISDTKFEDQHTTVLNYEFIKPFDVLHDISTGTFANKVISIDPLTRTIKSNTFNLDTYSKDSKTLNGNLPFTGLKDRFGNTEMSSPESVVSITFSNSSHQEVDWIKQNPGSDAHDIAAETYVPNRIAQIALANYTLLKLLIPGDTEIQAGMTIEFLVPSLQGIGQESDKYNSGKYLVTAVHHLVKAPSVFLTVLEVAKESVAEAYSAPNYNDGVIDGVITA